MEVTVGALGGAGEEGDADWQTLQGNTQSAAAGQHQRADRLRALPAVIFKTDLHHTANSAQPMTCVPRISIAYGA
eukprot:CAMPEP_0174381550 /NCGR_PEP_ID=MMETSP0811_2-20130205/124087_1 /TAXON_ID=73025 ORGANISM="Eutreptiella gymnastica-like, Strain CCMP1594" /NCGR_SAMPLE_ID=MMETSP0811_2 /ASSEMBLY_ACC=CAM_ASM_000667 /LENGTH=74 /DNA_ID=CAMNT_0015534729 /DNA_START=1378 /DNA_END=1602 /DNA_ORIENTATION=-